MLYRTGRLGSLAVRAATRRLTYTQIVSRNRGAYEAAHDTGVGKKDRGGDNAAT